MRHAVSHEKPECTGSGGHRRDQAAQKTCSRLKRLCSANSPKVAEVIGDSRGIAANEYAYEDQAEQRERLGAGENILDELPDAHALRIEERDESNHQYRNKLLHGQAYRVFRRECNRRDDPSRRRNCREQNTKIASEADRYRCDGPRLNYQEQCPTVKEAPKRRIRFPQVNILAARPREHPGQFTVRYRRENRE